MNKLVLFVLIILLCCSCGDQANNTNKNPPATSAINNQFIDKEIVNQIIEGCKQEYRKNRIDKSIDSIQIEYSDTSVEVKFLFKEDSDYSNVGVAYISKMRNDYLHGDLDRDGVDEIICCVSWEGGGSSWWNDILLFKQTKNAYKLIAFQQSPNLCGCKEGTNEGGSYGGNFYPEKIENGIVIGKSICWTKNDAHCCPSLKFNTTVKFEKNQLVFNSKKLIEHIPQSK